MHQWVLKSAIIAAASTIFMTSTAMAQLFNFNKSETTTSQGTQYTNPVMNQDQFKNKVNSLSTQTNTNLNQQLSADVAAQEKISPPIQGVGPSSVPPPQNDSNSSNESSRLVIGNPQEQNQGTTTAPATPTSVTLFEPNQQAPITPPPPPALSTPGYQGLPGTPGTNVNTGATVYGPPAPPPPAQAPINQQQTYTGFGVGNPSGPGTNPSNTNSNTGGFNIKY